MGDAQKILELGWRQAAVLLSESLPEIPNHAPSEDNIYIILTQDCDIAQPCFQKEPYAEILLAKPKGGVPDGNFLYGKHPRYLEFCIGAVTYRAFCHDRFLIDRKCLKGCTPSSFHPIDDSLRDIITNWIAKRYIRPAFPGTFNDSLKRESRDISKLLKANGHYFDQILVSITPRYEEAALYRVAIMLVMTDEDYSDEVLRLEAQKVVDQFEETIRGCSGLDVVDCRVVAEDQVTLSHLRIYDPWDFDYLTHRQSLLKST